MTKLCVVILAVVMSSLFCTVYAPCPICEEIGETCCWNPQYGHHCGPIGCGNYVEEIEAAACPICSPHEVFVGTNLDIIVDHRAAVDLTPNFQKLDNQPHRTPRSHPEFQKFDYQRHRTSPKSPQISKNLTTNPIEHPEVTPNFKNLTTNPIERSGATPNFKHLTTNPVEHPGVTPTFKNLTTNPPKQPGVTPTVSYQRYNPTNRSTSCPIRMQ
ncbi:hypothetical protein Fcan01_00191 [Folsomia candida]|uniref:Uncharacterized protein n=1 Tax=Folsomia candida TaxID=158441 RepID=A0A226F4D6_FOLCA|nr:hypothetical protein Fcan01_00191 [Folsomia candida]